MEGFIRKEAAARALEARLREVSKNARNFYDHPVRQLRTRLRDAYADVLLEDPTLAQAHDIETALWKWVFYKPVEEFRHRVRYAADAGEKGEEPLRKVKAALLKFLDEATAFYLQLISSVQTTYGDIGLRVGDGKSGGCTGPPTDQPLSTRHPASVASIYRCLICLGDLARYQTNVPSGKAVKDWSSAEQFYRTAARVHPAGGNAHNQLAVLATYRNAELSAVYHYFRSLAVAEPFLIARENLLLLFEQNRKRLEGLIHGADSARRLAEGRCVQQHVQGAQADEQLNMLLARFVRLQGILFTKIDLDTFGGIYDEVVSGLAAALDEPGTRLALLNPGRHGTESAILQLAVMVVFSLHEASHKLDGSQPRYAEALQQAEVLQHANMTACSVASQLLQCLVLPAALDLGLQRQELTGPLQLLLSWFADRDTLGTSELRDSRELTAYVHFLRAAVEYLQWFCQQTAHKVQPAAHELQPVLGPSVARDLNLIGFTPLEQGHSGAGHSPSSDEAGSAQQGARIVGALLRCRPLVDRCACAAMSGGGNERSAMTALAQQFGTVCDEVARVIAGACLGSAPPTRGDLETLPAHRDGDDDVMDSEEVIVYVPPTTVPQSAPGQAQLLPAAVPSTDGGGRQPNVADGEAEAPADAVQLFARSDHAPPLGDIDVVLSRHDGGLLQEHGAQGKNTSGLSQRSALPEHETGNADGPAATLFGGVRSPAQAPTAQPPDRPHGMLGWDLFENARASTGFSAFFGGSSADIATDVDDGDGHRDAKRPQGGDPGQDWSWLDDLAEQT